MPELDFQGSGCILNASAVTENSRLIQSDPQGVRASRLQFTVKGAGWTGTIKVKARVAGEGSRDNTLTTASTDFVEYLAITNKLTGAVIAGGTGVAADGVYECDITGLEVVVEHTRSAGSVTVRGFVAQDP